jgi:thiol:disulfide interchange protein DsbG
MKLLRVAFAIAALTLMSATQAEGVSADVMDSLAHSAYVVEGAAPPKQIVYAFSDPNCPYCSLMWRALQPYEQEGLQVRWVQLAVLAPDSAGKAATLLQSPEGGVAMKANEEHFDYSTGAGSIMPTTVTPAIRASLKNNLALMQQLGLFGTPAMVFQDSQSGKVEVKSGMPRPSSLGSLLGLPSLPVTDPLLSHFH